MKIVTKILFATAFCVIAGVASFAQAPCGDKDWNCKIEARSKLIYANGNDAESFYARAFAYQQLKRYSLAIADYSKYIALNPANKEFLADGYGERGSCYRESGDMVRALPDFNSAITLAPTKPRPYFYRGSFYIVQKLWSKALPDFNKSIELNPTEPEGYYNRGKVYQNLKLYAKSLADLNNYLSRDIANDAYHADGYDLRGFVYYKMGNTASAVADATKAIELSPKTVGFYTNRAAYYRKQGKITLAVADENMAASLK